jgi:hypothetical protein
MTNDMKSVQIFPVVADPPFIAGSQEVLESRPVHVKTAKPMLDVSDSLPVGMCGELGHRQFLQVWRACSAD